MVVLILLPSQVCNGFLTVSTWEILISWHFLALFGSFQYLPNLGTHYYKQPALVAQLVERGTSKRYTKVYICVMPRSTVQIRTGASLLLFNSKRVYNIIKESLVLCLAGGVNPSLYFRSSFQGNFYPHQII